MLLAACEQFLSKTEEQIQQVALETLEGHQRAMMGNMTVEEIYRERKTFSNAVFDVSKKDFVKFGMSIISYTLKDITDEVGYLKVSWVLDIIYHLDDLWRFELDTITHFLFSL